MREMQLILREYDGNARIIMPIQLVSFIYFSLCQINQNENSFADKREKRLANSHWLILFVVIRSKLQKHRFISKLNYYLRQSNVFLFCSLDFRIFYHERSGKRPESTVDDRAKSVDVLMPVIVDVAIHFFGQLYILRHQQTNRYAYEATDNLKYRNKKKNITKTRSKREANNRRHEHMYVVIRCRIQRRRSLMCL